MTKAKFKHYRSVSKILNEPDGNSVLVNAQVALAKLQGEARAATESLVFIKKRSRELIRVAAKKRATAAEKRCAASALGSVNRSLAKLAVLTARIKTAKAKLKAATNVAAMQAIETEIAQRRAADLQIAIAEFVAEWNRRRDRKEELLKASARKKAVKKQKAAVKRAAIKARAAVRLESTRRVKKTRSHIKSSTGKAVSREKINFENQQAANCLAAGKNMAVATSGATGRKKAVAVTRSAS